MQKTQGVELHVHLPLRSIPEGARILQVILTVFPLLGHHLLTLRFDPLTLQLMYHRPLWAIALSRLIRV
jgi:hypothetical protein